MRQEKEAEIASLQDLHHQRLLDLGNQNEEDMKKLDGEHLKAQQRILENAQRELEATKSSFEAGLSHLQFVHEETLKRIENEKSQIGMTLEERENQIRGISEKLRSTKDQIARLEAERIGQTQLFEQLSAKHHEQMFMKEQAWIEIASIPNSFRLGASSATCAIPD